MQGAISIGQATIDLCVAGGLSAAIGFERQWRNCLAGLRTNTLVALGAASFVIFGALFPEESSIAAGSVLFVNLLLRPIVAFINRQPLVAAEADVGYLVSVTCRSPDEAHVRALLLQGLASSGLALRQLDSNDLQRASHVAVTALATAPRRIDAEVEKIVGRLSLEPTVSAARWQADPQFDAENGALPNRGSAFDLN